jgi:hypothetical protein
MSSPSVLSPNNGLQAENLLNPLSPPVYGGLTTPDGAVDFTYPYNGVINPNNLAAGQTLQDVIATNTDAQFQMTAQLVNVYTDVRFGFQLNVNGVYFLSEGYILAGNLVSDPSAPPPLLGKFIIPRGANLNINLIDYSGAANTVQILFRGVKLYGKGRTAGPASPASQVPMGLGRRW